MNENDMKKMYEALAAPFPESCIQRTEGRLTGRGYDTTGIGYQHIANRLCAVVGIGGFRAHRSVTVKEFTRPNGRQAFEAICDLTLELGRWVDGKFVTFAEALADGGHVAASEADARKGAYTNAFKKAAAFFGVGRQAYEGTLDDDALPGDVDTSVAPVMKVVRAPVAPAPLAQPQVHSTPPGYTRTPSAADARPQQIDRNRISSKQLAALHSISRKLNLDPAELRARAKSAYGAQLEWLSKQAASDLITKLNAELHNGGEHHEEQPEAAS